MRKISIVLLLMIVAIILAPKPTYADMFSKPTATIHIKGIDVPYDFELLIFYDGDVPILDDEAMYKLEAYYKADYPIDVLNGYQDQDGYAARTLYSGGAPASLQLIDSNTIHVGYFSAPRTFKILLILEDDVFIVSKVIHRKMFTSKMTFDLTGVDLSTSKSNVGTLTEEIPLLEFSGKYILRILLTIGVELLVLLAFMYRDKKDFIFVGIVNFVTQSALTIAMVVGYYFWAAEVGLIITLVLGEITVFTIEMVVYGYKLDKQSRSKAYLYGFTANAITLMLTIFTLGSI